MVGLKTSGFETKVFGMSSDGEDTYLCEETFLRLLLVAANLHPQDASPHKTNKQKLCECKHQCRN